MLLYATPSPNPPAKKKALPPSLKASWEAERAPGWSRRFPFVNCLEPQGCRQRGAVPGASTSSSCRSCSSRLGGHVHYVHAATPPGTHSLTVSPARRCGSLCHPPAPRAGTSARSPARERWSRGPESIPSPRDLAFYPLCLYRASQGSRRSGEPRGEVILSDTSEELSPPRGCSSSPLPCFPNQGGLHGCLLPPAGHTESVKKLPVGSRRCPSRLVHGLHQGPKVVPHMLDARKEQQMMPLTLTMVPGQLWRSELWG